MSREVISLFAGCGGSSLGYQMAGCKVLCAVEKDPHASSAYRLNFQDTTFLEADITKLDPIEVMHSLSLQPEELTILDGSPPCQGFSMLGKREIGDPRNRLFLDYVRFLKALKPQAFVMENVPGLVSGQMKSVFLEMVHMLEGEGYRTQARILNAAYYGVSQSRKRLIILGIRSDLNMTPQYPVPRVYPIPFRKAVKELIDHQRILHPTGRALELAKALRPGESGSVLHRRYGRKENDYSLIRLSWDKPSPTVPKTIRQGQCGLLHPSEDRFLSIGELKRVCSFPDEFQLPGSFEERWGRLGNAVPPLLTHAVAECLIHQLEAKGG